MKSLPRTVSVLLIPVCCLAAIPASGATLSSISFSPVSGAWNTANPTVRVDFGNGLGLGTISITSVNGGAYQNIATPDIYNNPGFSPTNSPTLLSNGDLFAPSQESVFGIQPGTAVSGLVGFMFTVTLDSGSFTPGSLFSVRSLGVNTNTGNAQYVQPGAGLGTPLPEQLPTDGAVMNQGDWGLLNPGQNLYGNSLTGISNGASRGVAFPISGNSFTASLLATPGYNPGGVAWTIVTAPVPEPSIGLLAGLSLLAAGSRRRKPAGQTPAG